MSQKIKWIIDKVSKSLFFSYVISWAVFNFSFEFHGNIKNIKINKKNLCENLCHHKLSSRAISSRAENSLSNHNSSILFTTITDIIFIDEKDRNVMKNLLLEEGGKITQIIIFNVLLPVVWPLSVSFGEPFYIYRQKCLDENNVVDRAIRTLTMQQKYVCWTCDKISYRYPVVIKPCIIGIHYGILSRKSTPYSVLLSSCNVLILIFHSTLNCCPFACQNAAIFLLLQFVDLWLLFLVWHFFFGGKTEFLNIIIFIFYPLLLYEYFKAFSLLSLLFLKNLFELHVSKIWLKIFN